MGRYCKTRQNYPGLVITVIFDSQAKTSYKFNVNGAEIRVGEKINEFP